MTSLAHTWQSDADRAADAIVSLRNDEVMRHLSRHFHEQFTAHPNSTRSPRVDNPISAGVGTYTNTPEKSGKGIAA